MTRTVYTLLLPLLLFVAVAADARVFRWKGAAPDELNNGNLPWETAYRTKMTVNGQPARMHVYSARYNEPVVAQLKARLETLGAEVQVSRSPDGATGSAVWPDRRAGFIVLSPHDQPQQTVMVYFPEAGKAKREVVFPVPEYTRGRRRTTVSDDGSNTFLAVVESNDSPTEIHGYYARELPAAGWELVAPAVVADGTVRGMAVYRKKNKICYVQAVGRTGQPSMLTLLVKGGSL